MSGIHDGASPAARRALRAVAGLNLAMAVIEGGAGIGAESQALLADSLDFLEDGATAALALLAVEGPPARQRRIARLQAAAMALLALGVLAGAALRALQGSAPLGGVVGATALLALAVNGASTALLLRHREAGVNLRAVWLSGRNDMIANLVVLAAGLLVLHTGSRWPDLAAGALLATLFLHAALDIWARAGAGAKTP